ncbi:MAG: HEAT repeat domain-containing protein [Pirellulaceae bacterium]|nr:HEAT repeat domain-containing protein [Pirellulaceae bacterium]
MTRIIATTFAALLIIHLPQTASGYLVANVLSLDELQTESEVIFKGTVVTTGPIEDESFESVHGFEPYQTVFEIVSVIKGDIKSDTVRFRHYGESDGAPMRMYMPQHYSFQLDRTYIVCAKKSDAPNQFRQLWDHHRSKEDQGVLLAHDIQPHSGRKLTEIYWHELQGLLQGDDAADTSYAIEQLGALTGIGHGSHTSLDRVMVVDAIANLIDSPDDEIAQQAIRAIGQENPTMGGNIWALIRLNPAHFPGHGTLEKPDANKSAQRHQAKLIQMAQSDRSPTVRALAILSLADTQSPVLRMLAQKWASDDSSSVRAAAAILLADYADNLPIDVWQKLMSDQSNTVRVDTIRAIGIGQVSGMIPMLSELLSDDDPKVVSSAAASLLSFSIDDTRSIMQRQTDHGEFGCVFVNALATENVALYTSQLGHIIRTDPHPKQWWGGHVPWGVAWNLLFIHVQKQPQTKIRSGEMDMLLDYLESPITAFEKSNHYSSSEPRDLYALYIQRGLRRRAKEYRMRVNQKTSYDMDLYFDRVDAHPDHFLRN